MALTDVYRKQHEELIAVVGQISEKLDESCLADADAAEVSDLVKVLAGKLLVHLAAEDNALYPKMLNSGNIEAAETAKRFQEEMGGLKTAFEDYYRMWANPRAIAASPGDFIEQTKTVLEALGNRVEKENTLLYPLADRI